MTTEDDDELKEFGLDGAERVAPTPGFVTGFSLMSAQEKGVFTHEEIAKFNNLRSIDSIDLSPDSVAKLGEVRAIDPDFGPRTETARQMSKIINFGIAAGLSNEAIRQTGEFLTTEEIEEFAHSLRRPANATWSVSVKSKTVL